GVELAWTIGYKPLFWVLNERISQAIPTEKTGCWLTLIHNELASKDQIALFVEAKDQIGPSQTEWGKLEVEIENLNLHHDPLVLCIEVTQVNNRKFVLKLANVTIFARFVIELRETESLSHWAWFRTPTQPSQARGSGNAFRRHEGLRASKRANPHK